VSFSALVACRLHIIGLCQKTGDITMNVPQCKYWRTCLTGMIPPYFVLNVLQKTATAWHLMNTQWTKNLPLVHCQSVYCILETSCKKKLPNFTANFYTTTNRTVQNKQHHAQYWASLASNGELQRDGNYDGAQAILAATEALCPSIIYLPLFRNNVGKLIPD